MKVSRENKWPSGAKSGIHLNPLYVPRLPTLNSRVTNQRLLWEERLFQTIVLSLIILFISINITVEKKFSLFITALALTLPTNNVCVYFNTAKLDPWKFLTSLIPHNRYLFTFRKPYNILFVYKLSRKSYSNWKIQWPYILIYKMCSNRLCSAVWQSVFPVQG